MTMTLTSTTQKALDALNAHDLAAYAALFAEDAMVHDPTFSEPLRGRDAIAKDWQDFFRAFPDASFTVGSSMQDGDREANEWRISGTHSGPLSLPTGEIPPSGKAFTIQAGEFSRFSAGGQYVESQRYYDVNGWLAQLGVAP